MKWPGLVAKASFETAKVKLKKKSANKHGRYFQNQEWKGLTMGIIVAQVVEMHYYLASGRRIFLET